MFDTIQCGDRVTIKTPQGQEVTGRAVMFNRKVGAWVLNLGGRRALPGLVMIFPGDVARAFKEGWQGRKVCDEPTVERFKAGWRPDPVDIMQSLLARVTDESFADWFSSLGYEEDSRRAHATWTNCRELDRVCRAMFGKDFDNAQRIAWEF